MKKMILIGFMFVLWGSATSQIIDHFDSASSAWNPLFGQAVVQNGKLNLSSDSTTQFAWNINTSADFGDFEVTVQADLDNANTAAILGIAFRIQNNLDCYRFYIYPGGYFLVDKYISGSPASIFPSLKSNSFIRNQSNSITVMGKGNVFSFYCNGQLLYKLTDATLSSPGKLGVFVQGPKRTAQFDDFSANNAPNPGPGLSRFSDDFADGDLFGWRNYAGAGTFTPLTGTVQGVGAGSANNTFCILHSDGNYGESDTLQVETDKISGGTAFGYGLKFHYSPVLVDSSLRNVGYLFYIVGGNYYTLLKLGRSGVTSLFTAEISLVITQTKNTLKVICHPGGQMDLYANGTKLKTVTDTDFPSGGAGLMVQGDLTVKFDNFNISGQAPVSLSRIPGRAAAAELSISVFPNPARGISRITPLGNLGDRTPRVTVYTMSGEKVESLQSTRWDSTPYPSGVYLIQLEAGGKTAVKRLAVLK